MDQTITASDANRKFSQLMRGVSKGLSYLVTSHGKPLARISPADNQQSEKEKRVRAKAHKVLMKRLRSQKAINIGPWTREELYEDVL